MVNCDVSVNVCAGREGYPKPIKQPLDHTRTIFYVHLFETHCNHAKPVCARLQNWKRRRDTLEPHFLLTIYQTSPDRLGRSLFIAAQPSGMSEASMPGWSMPNRATDAIQRADAMRDEDSTLQSHTFGY